MAHLQHILFAFIVLSGSNLPAQLLPPQTVSMTDTRQKIGGNEALTRCQDAVAALRGGDFKSVSARLAGSDFVVSPADIPALQPGELRFFTALVAYADESPNPQNSVWTSVVRELLTDSDTQFSGSRRVDASDAELLSALVFLRKKIGVLALIHAQLGVTARPVGEAPRRAAPRLVNQLKSLNTIDSDLPEIAGPGLNIWRSQASAAPQALVIAWQRNQRDFVGALTVDRNPNATAGNQRYQIVFRDLDGPPLLLMECGPELPGDEALLEFAQQFSADDRRNHAGFTRLRCQMEAIYAAQAELAPLAAAWRQEVTGPDALLTEQVENPLRAGHAWNWVLRTRDGAGDLNGLRVLVAKPAGAASSSFVFEFGPGGLPSYEVLGYVNRDVERLDSKAEPPERLEHFHFAVGAGETRLHLASFRLVSDRVGAGDRLYSWQYLTHGELVTLDVTSEPPSFEEFRDRVLGCINGWSKPSRLTPVIVNSIGMKFAMIPAGEYLMGSTAVELKDVVRRFPETKPAWVEDENPQHHVRISQPFYLGVHEVTLREFLTFYHDAQYKTDAERDGKGGWGWTGEKFEQSPKFVAWSWGNESQTQQHPVVNVSWNDAVAFCEWLSRKERVRYRLPTEAEWEYACRAGTTTLFYSGNDPETLVQVGNVPDAATKETLKFPGWAYVNGRDGYAFTAPVGSFRPNAFGLYDMHGNVWEWCSDWYGPYDSRSLPEQLRERIPLEFNWQRSLESGALADPIGLIEGEERVIRGGSWNWSPQFCRSARRSSSLPGNRYHNLGFRVARSIEPTTEQTNGH